MIKENRYSISELADAAKVSPRTIRYYTEIGLLPQPELDGKYTVYDEHHLDRLKLIAHLKSSYLPLKEISRYMAGKSDEEIAVEVNSTRVEKVEDEYTFFRSFNNQAELNSASDYLRSVMEPGSAFDVELNNSAAPNQGGNLEKAPMPNRILASEPMSKTMRGRVEREEQKEDWERYTLEEGIELHVRRSIDQNTRANVETLLGLAKKLFRGKPRGRKNNEKPES